MQARYYDPVIGRFLSVDPVTFSPDKPQQFNRYWYANGNPYSYVDPDGEFAWALAGAAIGAVGAAAIEMYSQHKQGKSFNNMDFGKVGSSALKGAAVGFVATATAGLGASAGVGLVGQTAGATVVATTEALALNATESEIFDDNRSAEEILVDSVAAGTGAGVAAPVSNPIASVIVSGSIEAITKEFVDQASDSAESRPNDDERQ